MRALMSDSYAHALADVRSCLAALADLSRYDQSIEYEQLLLDLDAMHGGMFPAAYPVTGSVADLNSRTDARLNELAHMGADPLTVELLLARLEEISRSQARDPPHQSAHIGPHSAKRAAHSTSSRCPDRACRAADGHASRWTCADSSRPVIHRRPLHRRPPRRHE